GAAAYPRRLAACEAGENRQAARDPGAPRIARGARRHAERALDVLSHRDRQAIRPESFQRNFPRVVRRGRTAKALHRARAAQGGLPSIRRGRMQRPRDYVDQWTRHAQRACPLHQGGGPSEDGPQCDGEGGHPMTRREFNLDVGETPVSHREESTHMNRKSFLVGLLAAGCFVATSTLMTSPGNAQADQKVAKAMAILKAETAKLGAPKVEGTDQTADKTT